MLDKDMREPLFDFMDEYFGKIRTIEEKTIKKSRADVIGVMDDAILGFEIKSDGDTYTRLKNQVKYYNCFFDRNIIVTGTSHAAHIKEHVPDWWGIITVELDENGKVDFYIMRKADVNPKLIDECKISILWRRELNNLLEKNKLPQYKAKSKYFVQKTLLKKVPAEILWPQAYDELFERDYTTIAQEILEFRRKKKK